MNELYLRNVTSDDCELLFDWVNNPLVRANSVNTELISLDQHSAWFQSKLKDKNTKMYILTDGSHNIGQIRIDWIDGFWSIDYSIDSEFRGKGYGKLMVKLLTTKKILPLKALVKKSNGPSAEIFVKIGFRCKEIILNDIPYLECIFDSKFDN